ncbi:Glycosyltransferase involved in cell wall bisynthesis [Desulfotomaculum arcticum]|uniref:Glycosyltransferase involved in cell wall bisynthesis n=1 Tax=Desulfotruncus arcticus DSM 17038 TaxID=1121424 RepID=A0A1I2NAH0_9FIRM|nr:glycosyltransferase family 4 protein [Desulfotruncus arcticus]SFG00508.1 Glycosyltransferase involved in cell wall bisynthesis [Desulfotomaculum arcticum] [Desulfotruncus arcticus DSM 17038]
MVRPTEGGIGKHISVLTENLIDYFDVTVACPENSTLEQKLKLSGIKTLSLPLKGTVSRQDLSTLKILYQYMRSKKVKLVHSHGAKAALLARPAAVLAKVPVNIYTAHNSIINSNWPSWKNNLAAMVDYVLSWPTDSIITVSGALGEEISKFERIPRSKIKVIPNGIDYKAFNKILDRKKLKSDFGIPWDRQVIGTVARMAPQKGLHILIQAAELLVKEFDLHFLMVGDGPLKKTLQEQVQNKALGNRFIFTGALEDVSAAYSVMDFFVLPSLTEGLPLSLLEAMAFNLPVLASRVGGIPEVIDDKECGMLVAPGDFRDLVQSIAYLLKNPGLARQYSTKARQKIVKEFCVTRTIKETVNLYLQLLQEKVEIPSKRYMLYNRT